MNDLVKQFENVSIKSNITFKDVKKALTIAVVKNKLGEALQWGLYIGLSSNEKAVINLWEHLLTLAVEYISLESVDCVVIVESMRQKYYDEDYNEKPYLCYAISYLCASSKTNITSNSLNEVKEDKNKGKESNIILYKNLIKNLESKNYKNSVRIACILYNNGIKHNDIVDKSWFQKEINDIKYRKYVDHLIWCAIITVSKDFDSDPYPSIDNICKSVSGLKLARNRTERSKLFWAHCIGIICFREHFQSLLFCRRKRKGIHNCWYAKRIIEAAYGFMKYSLPNNLDNIDILESKKSILCNINKDKMIIE